MGSRSHPDAEGWPYFITCRTSGRKPIFASPSAGRLFVDTLLELRRERGFRLLAYVVMPDHVHFIIAVEASGPLALVMQLIKGRFARRYNAQAGRGGPVWQPWYYETVLRGEEAFLRAVEYVETNPSKAGLAVSPQAWAFSSAAAGRPDFAEYLGLERS